MPVVGQGSGEALGLHQAGGLGEVREAAGHEAEQVLGVLQVLQAVDAEVDELGTVRQRVADVLLGGQRQQHVAAVSRGHEPAGAA